MGPDLAPHHREIEHSGIKTGGARKKHNSKKNNKKNSKKHSKKNNKNILKKTINNILSVLKGGAKTGDSLGPLVSALHFLDSVQDSIKEYFIEHPEDIEKVQKGDGCSQTSQSIWNKVIKDIMKSSADNKLYKYFVGSNNYNKPVIFDLGGFIQNPDNSKKTLAKIMSITEDDIGINGGRSLSIRSIPQSGGGARGGATKINTGIAIRKLKLFIENINKLTGSDRDEYLTNLNIDNGDMSDIEEPLKKSLDNIMKVLDNIDEQTPESPADEAVTGEEEENEED